MTIKAIEIKTIEENSTLAYVQCHWQFLELHKHTHFTPLHYALPSFSICLLFLSILVRLFQIFPKQDMVACSNLIDILTYPFTQFNLSGFPSFSQTSSHVFLSELYKSQLNKTCSSLQIHHMYRFFLPFSIPELSCF